MKPRLKVAKPAVPLSATEGVGFEEITLAEQAHRQLRRDIISGAIPPSQPLRLEYLKARYGISFSPLREALNRLHSERLVVLTPSRGFRVAPFSEAEMWDAIDTRIVIDCEALRRSLARGDDDWETRLVAAFHALVLVTGRRVPGAPDPLSPDELQLEARHHDFHRGLIAACGSRWLMELSAQLYAQTERYRQPSLRDQHYWAAARDVSAEHRQLLEAAVARDADRATALLTKHYRATGERVRQVLLTQGGQSLQV